MDCAIYTADIYHDRKKCLAPSKKTQYVTVTSTASVTSIIATAEQTEVQVVSNSYDRRRFTAESMLASVATYKTSK